MKVLHVTTGLESGGAETLLTKLVGDMSRDGFECAVVSLTDGGPILGRRIIEQGIALECLGYPRGVPHPGLVARLVCAFQRFRPDVVQTWLYHADLVGALAHVFYRRAPLIWGLHNTELDAGKAKRLTIGVTRLNARLSCRVPAQIVCCSEAVRQDHARLGYCREKLRVISNGIDTSEFVPDLEARRCLRQELRLAPDTPLIGLIARFDPQKDHETFVRAAGILHRDRPDVQFVLCGTGVTAENPVLNEWIASSDIGGVTHLLGLRADTARVTAALDAATCCSSYAESFGLVLAEAVACGVPCVTTDLDGPVSVVGESGWIIPIGDAAALAAAWQEMLSLTPNQRQQWAERARQRIEAQFSLEKMVRGYEDMYREFDAVGSRKS